MKKISVVLVSLMFVLIFVPAVFASDTAKTLGMAGAVVAIEDLSAPIYNPALLAKMGERKIGVSIGSVRQVIDMSVPGIPDLDGLHSDASQIVPLDNIGFVMPFGPGTAYVGFNTEKRFLGAIKDILSDSSIYADTTTCSPTIAYGMSISPALSLGAALSYNYMCFSNKLESDSVNIPIWKISRNIGVHSDAADRPGSLPFIARSVIGEWIC
jgi:long-subunit fatty acid transport protein